MFMFSESGLAPGREYDQHSPEQEAELGSPDVSHRQKSEVKAEPIIL